MPINKLAYEIEMEHQAVMDKLHAGWRDLVKKNHKLASSKSFDDPYCVGYQEALCDVFDLILKCHKPVTFESCDRFYEPSRPEN